MWNMLIPMAIGALSSKANYDAKQAQQRRTADAEADATKVSWARRNGQGNIPKTQFNNTSELGSIMSGGLSGAAFGSQFGDSFAPQTYGADKMAEFEQSSQLLNPKTQAGRYGLGVDLNVSEPIDYLGLKKNMMMMAGR